MFSKLIPKRFSGTGGEISLTLGFAMDKCGGTGGGGLPSLYMTSTSHVSMASEQTVSPTD